MKQKPFISFLVLAVALSLYGSAHAFGVGFSFTGGAINNTATASNSAGSSSKNVMQYDIGASLILDTAVATNKLINYRLSLGYSNCVTKDLGFFGSTSEHRIIWCNTLGVGVFRSDAARIYMGPQLMVSFDFQYNSGIDNPLIMGYFGLVLLGLNIHGGDHFSFTMELGGRGGYGAFIKANNLRVLRLEPFTSFGCIFRIGDTFSSGNNRINPQVETVQDLIDREKRQ